MSTLYEELCHHEQVFQESTLFEELLSLILHEKRFRLCEHYGQQMILLNHLVSTPDDDRRYELDGRYAVHALDVHLLKDGRF